MEKKQIEISKKDTGKISKDDIAYLALKDGTIVLIKDDSEDLSEEKEKFPQEEIREADSSNLSDSFHINEKKYQTTKNIKIPHFKKKLTYTKSDKLLNPSNNISSKSTPIWKKQNNNLRLGTTKGLENIKKSSLSPVEENDEISNNSNREIVNVNNNRIDKKNYPKFFCKVCNKQMKPVKIYKVIECFPVNVETKHQKETISSQEILRNENKKDEINNYKKKSSKIVYSEIIKHSQEKCPFCHK